MSTTRRLLAFAIVIVFMGLSAARMEAQTLQVLSDDERQALENEAKELQALVAGTSQQPPEELADAAIFAKGLTWALRYDREFSPADIDLIRKAGPRCRERLAALNDRKRPWIDRRGKIALGYVSAVDGSAQPYGLILPKDYDPNTAIRLDVVLHGSTRPVGISELRFLARFQEADGTGSTVPDQPYIELHPLGRVENCYRWAGETDVFEAIEDVSRRFNIDRNRIVLRGMSMGASGTWHLGLKHPDRFAALGPYCGYVDTHKFSETSLDNFVRVGPLPDYQELGLHMLDSIDYAANAGVVPVVACMGEKDIFFQAHVLMSDAMQREGLTLTNLISPGTGHVIDPLTHAEQMRRIAEFVAKSPRHPRELRFVTWTLKYNRCHWLELLALDRHYARAELSAKLQDDLLVIDEPRNVTRFAIIGSKLPARPAAVRVGTSQLVVPKTPRTQDDRIVIARRDDRWQILEDAAASSLAGKRPGLQGPIDDAFTTPFLCVRGTGKPWNQAVDAYAQASLRRFADEWHHYFRGELPVKDDVAVTDDDLRTRNLILFGDPGSNSWIAKTLPHLPMTWTKESFQLAGRTHSSSRHVPALIAPNVLPGGEDHYVVINSGHTFRESELAKLNYLLFPRWGDWAVLKIDPARGAAEPLEDNVVQAGYFDEQWK